MMSFGQIRVGGLRFMMLIAMIAGGCASDAQRRSEQDMIVVEKKSDRQYLVEFDGACAMALADGKIQLGDQRYMLQHEGKTYYFGSAEAKKKFEQNLKDNLQYANQSWQEAMVGAKAPS